METQGTAQLTKRPQSVLMLGALGVVFGDIGTSPLYAMRACLGIAPTRDDVMGIISLIVWSLVFVVSLKYVFLVMSASNRGEGGIIALMSLAAGGARRLQKKTGFWAILGLCGAALFFGDSLITPAVSVLSAVEGLTVFAPTLSSLVLPISVVILVLLFMFQHVGTHRVGAWFGPVMVLWFLAIAAMGVRGIFMAPEILMSVNPLYAVRVLSHSMQQSSLIIGGVILAFTGVEALYADMGHFGRKPIRSVWFSLVFPCLLLNYFGQGALLLVDSSAALNPFFRLVPEALALPMVGLAAAATVIASQSVISGSFSLAQQAIHLGYLPRIDVKHTSAHESGQIYIPKINWILCAGVILLVLMFRSSEALAGAYGLAVTGTMLMTTCLVFGVARHVWRWSVYRIVMTLSIFLLLDMMFWGAALTKLFSGGWLPLAIGAFILCVFLTWHQGRKNVNEKRMEKEQKLGTFLNSLSIDTARLVPGTVVYLSTLRATVPAVFLRNLRANKAIHETIIILSVKTEKEVPRVTLEERCTLNNLSKGFWLMTLRYGFMEKHNVFRDLPAYLPENREIDLKDISYFAGHYIFVESSSPVIKPVWRARLFLWLSNYVGSMFDYLCIPPEKGIEIGVRVEI